MAIDPFTLAEDSYRALVLRRREEGLHPREFRMMVRRLGVTDAEGNDWIIGPENGAWYRRDRDRWVPAEPPRRLVCPACEHPNLGRHSFCVQCGVRLDR